MIPVAHEPPDVRWMIWLLSLLVIVLAARCWIRLYYRSAERACPPPPKSADEVSAAEVFALALSLYDGDAELAIGWLNEPNLALDLKPPVKLLGTAEGCARVKNLLLRCQYGVLA